MTNKIINRLFRFASKEQADKLIISRSEQDFSCRCQLPYGEETIFKLPKKLETNLAAGLRQLLKVAPEELTDGKYCKIKDKSYRLNFHVSIIPHGSGEKIIINIIKDGQKIIGLNRLGLRFKTKNELKTALKRRSGLIIISSETRQGRSTTLFSCLQAINHEQRAVYFLGAQPEFDLEGVNYLNSDTTNWEKVLKHDSEVIALDSEDSADWRRAVQAAATGRLVIMSMPATNALEALYKLLDLGLPRKLLIDNLRLVSGQALIDLKRVAIKNRRQPVKKSRLGKSRQKIGIFEVLTLNKELAAWLLDADNSYQVAAFWQHTLLLAYAADYQPMSADLTDKKKEGLL